MALVDFKRISFDEANPGLMGALRAGQVLKQPYDLQHQKLANELMRIQNQFAPQREQSRLDLQKNQSRNYDLINQKMNIQQPFIAQKSQAELALQNAQGQEAMARAEKLKSIAEVMKRITGNQSGQNNSNNSSMPIPEDIAYKQLGIDTYGQRNKENSIQNAQRDKKLASLSDEASASNEGLSIFNRWNSIMENPNVHSGSIMGLIPSEGLGTLLSPRHNNDLEQEADYLQKQMKPIALKIIRSARGEGRMNQYDDKMTENLKFTRTMTPATRKLAGEWLKAQSERAQERLKFYSDGYHNGFTTHELDTSWNKYIQNRPLINKDQTEVQYQNAGKSDQYLNNNSKKNSLTISVEQAKKLKSMFPEQHEEMISVISPDNKRGKVPASQLKAALEAGYKKS